MTTSSMNMFIPITKVDAAQRLVYGVLASETVDKTGEVFDYESSKPFVKEWSGEIEKATGGKSQGNLRFMHTKEVVGKFTQVECDDASKSVLVCAKVSDNTRWNQVLEGEVSGFSVGGSYEKRWTDPDGLKRYTAKPSEGSLVDNPANADCHFSMIKADGTIELKKFHTAGVTPAATPETPAVAAELEQVWKTSDGKTFATKAEAKTHNDTLTKVDPIAETPAAKLAAELAGFKDDVAKMAEAPVEKRDFTEKQRANAAEKGEAMPSGQFPIKSKEDLGNAVKAFGRAKDKKAVKAHIVKRAKDLGAEDALPDAWKPGADKALRFGDLRKGLYEVSRFACLIQELDYLQECSEYEAEREKDGSVVPNELKQAVTTLAAILRAMVEEETNELLDEDEMIEFGEDLEMSFRTSGVNALAKTLGAKAPAWLAKVGMRHGKDDQAHLNAAHDHLAKMGIGKCMKAEYAAGDALGKAGARHSKADLETLGKAHDLIKAAGGECPGGEAASTDAKDVRATKDGEAEKMTKLLEGANEKNAVLEKQMTETSAAIAELRAQVAKFAKSPLPRPHERAATHVVTKGEPDSPFAQLEKLTPEERNAYLIEYARALPRHVNR